MIKIAIVDDEEQTREQILRTLKENIQEQYEVEIKLYASGESFFEEIQKGEAADILFTDIQIQQLDGVELGKLVRRLCLTCTLSSSHLTKNMRQKVIGSKHISIF